MRLEAEHELEEASSQYKRLESALQAAASAKARWLRAEGVLRLLGVLFFQGKMARVTSKCGVSGSDHLEWLGGLECTAPEAQLFSERERAIMVEECMVARRSRRAAQRTVHNCMTLSSLPSLSLSLFLSMLGPPRPLPSALCSLCSLL